MIGQQIKELRLSLGMGQAEFAQETGSSQPIISYVENGHAPPSIDLVYNIVNKYRHKGVTYEWLLEGKARQRKPKTHNKKSGERLQRLANNIREIIRLEKISPGQLALQCHIKPERLGEILELQAMPTLDEILNLLENFSTYNANWFLRGRGLIKLLEGEQQWEEMLQAQKKIVEALEEKMRKVRKL